MEKLWWYTQNEEVLDGSRSTREGAIEEGTRHFCGEPFMICQGAHFRNRFDIFDWVAERFDDVNEDYAGENYASERWTIEHIAELEAALTAVMTEWAERHGYHEAYSIDCGEYERIVPNAPAVPA